MWFVRNFKTHQPEYQLSHKREWWVDAVSKVGKLSKRFVLLWNYFLKQWSYNFFSYYKTMILANHYMTISGSAKRHRQSWQNLFVLESYSFAIVRSISKTNDDILCTRKKKQKLKKCILANRFKSGLSCNSFVNQNRINYREERKAGSMCYFVENSLPIKSRTVWHFEKWFCSVCSPSVFQVFSPVNVLALFE